MTSAISFCNDIDYADWETYKAVHQELETMGIKVTDSFWLYSPSGSEMALFKTNIREKAPKHDELLTDINSGKLNILHSLGDFSSTSTDFIPTREMMQEGLEYLKQHANVPLIWTNHGDYGDIDNIVGSGSHYNFQGDSPSSPIYVIDLLLQYGVRFFWTVSSSKSLNQFVFSASDVKTMDRTFNSMFSTPLALIEKVTTEAGFTINSFGRYGFDGTNVPGPDAQTIWRQLTKENLEKLAHAKNGYCILYQHWACHREAGKTFTAGRPIFPPKSRQALEYLSGMVQEGRLRIMNVLDMLLEAEDKLNVLQKGVI